MKIENRLGKGIILACTIHTLEEKALGGGPKSGVEKKNQEKESESQLIP